MGTGWKRTGQFGVALFLPLLLVLTSTTVPVESADSCSSYSFSQNREFATCVTLSQLSCFLHWSYNASSATVDIAFRATEISTSNWVAWALNPAPTSSNYMYGAQALVAYKHSNGSTWAYTSSIVDTSTTLAESDLSFKVTDVSTESSGSQMIIFAKVQLPNNKTSIAHLWQVGPLKGGSPIQHELTTAHKGSQEIFNFLSGVAQSTGDSRQRKKNIHGVLSAVSWGTLLPIGFLIARYLKVFKSADPAWFYLHVTCQCTAYIVGVAGWALGLKLGSESVGITYHSHRIIGILIFCFATLQVCALLWRPRKDHKYRRYWNMFHHGAGYKVIILSIVNVFKGIHILDPANKWKTIYIVILVILASIAVFLEVITWIIVLKRKKNERLEPKTNAYSGEPNGYAFTTRPQPYV